MKNVLHAWLVKTETLTEQIVGRDHKVVAMELRPSINEKNKANNVELGKIQSYKNYSDNLDLWLEKTDKWLSEVC